MDLADRRFLHSLPTDHELPTEKFCPTLDRNWFFDRQANGKFGFYFILAGPPGAARDYFTISLCKSPVQNDLRTLWALGWGEPPTNNFFIYKPTPRSNFGLLAPAQFSKHTPPFGRVDPVGSKLE